MPLRPEGVAVIDGTPQPGDIGLTQIHGSVGRWIRFGEWLNGDGFGEYTHAFLVLANGELLEADPGGARIRPLHEHAAARTVYVAPAGLSDAQRQAICSAGRRYVGVKYSFADYLAIAAHRIHLPFPGLRAYVASTHDMICSQLVDQAYQDAGVHLFNDGRWPGYVTPMALWDLLGKPQR